MLSYNFTECVTNQPSEPVFFLRIVLCALRHPYELGSCRKSGNHLPEDSVKSEV